MVPRFTTGPPSVETCSCHVSSSNNDISCYLTDGMMQGVTHSNEPLMQYQGHLKLKDDKCAVFRSAAAFA